MKPAVVVIIVAAAVRVVLLAVTLLAGGLTLALLLLELLEDLCRRVELWERGGASVRNGRSRRGAGEGGKRTMPPVAVPQAKHLGVLANRLMAHLPSK